MPSRDLTGEREAFKGGSGPQVICLTCGADDRDRRIREIEVLVLRLEGVAQVQSVTGRTTALAVSLPRAHAARFAAALALIGATTLSGDGAEPPPEFLVVLTQEPSPSERRDP